MRHKGEADNRDKTGKEMGLGGYRWGLARKKPKKEKEEEYIKKTRSGSTARATNVLNNRI